MKRREEREQAFFLIFERSFRDDSLEEILDAALAARDIQVAPYAEKVFHGIEQYGSQIDAVIEENIIGWKRSRLSRVASSILQVAVYEMLFEESIPSSVSISEAVSLAKLYGTQEESSFVNGVLGGIARKLEKNDA